MSAGAEVRRLQARVTELEQQLADLEDQRDAARRTVEQQQEEHAAWRLAHPVQPHRLIGGGRATPRDVPTGDLL